MMKNLISICKSALIVVTLVTTFVLVGKPLTARADEGGFYIENFDSYVTVYPDASCDVQVEMDVVFTEDRHGIYAYLPGSVCIDRVDTEGNVTTEYYSPNCYNHWVDEYNWKVDGQTIIIGDEDVLVNGPIHYSYGYTYEFGDDRTDAYDELYYSLIGNGWDCQINNAYFQIYFEKGADLSEIQFYSGPEGTSSSDNVYWEIDESENIVYGQVLNGLNPRDALTVFLRLPNGYYDQVVPYESNISLWVVIGIIIAAIAGIRMLLVNMRSGTVVETVEFYPPDDVSSADAGYVTDMFADNEDFLSLIVWFACKKFIKIEEIRSPYGDPKDRPTVTIKPVKELPESAPLYMKEIFKALKKTGAKRGEAMYNALGVARTSLEDSYKGKRALTSSLKKFANKALYLIILALLGLEQFEVMKNASDMVIIIFPGLTLYTAFWMYVGYKLEPLNMSARWVKISTVLGLVIPYLIFFAIDCAILGTNMIFGDIVFHGLCLLSILFVAHTSTATAYRATLIGKLKGFKNFISTAELDRINMLCNDNPEYFYDILPYAYVFGLTDVWIKQFESIPVKPLFGDASDMGTVLYAHSLINSCSSLKSDVQKNITTYNEARSKSTSSSSGGGFGSSGGGFGGGGGGSW